jgi:hypothetical protein
MMDTTSHDHLFKEVLGQFFSEFIDLFFPDIAAFLDRDSIQFEPLEVFPDLLKGKANTTDLIVKAKFLGTDTYFIIWNTKLNLMLTSIAGCSNTLPF